MPFGSSCGPLSRRETTRIAQRFNAGSGQFCVAPVPKGRLNPSNAGRVPLRPALGRPFGTWGHLSAKPSVETLGYSRMSLRDKGVLAAGWGQLSARTGPGTCRHRVKARVSRGQETRRGSGPARRLRRPAQPEPKGRRMGSEPRTLNLEPRTLNLEPQGQLRLVIGPGLRMRGVVVVPAAPAPPMRSEARGYF